MSTKLTKELDTNAPRISEQPAKPLYTITPAPDKRPVDDIVIWKRGELQSEHSRVLDQLI